MKDGSKHRRFLVIESYQLILIEPDPKRLGWGVAKLVGFLQDVEVVGDKDDSRCLHLTIHRGGVTTSTKAPILAAKFQFDDHIRCMAAKQQLTKGRSKARQTKMRQIAHLLAIPGQVTESPVVNYAQHVMRSIGGSGGPAGQRTPRDHRPIFSASSNRVPGVAAALRRENMPGVSRVQISPAQRHPDESPSGGGHRRRSTSQQAGQGRQHSNGSPTSGGGSKSRDASRSGHNTRSRDGSPRSYIRPRSEEIPLEDFRRSQNSSPLPLPVISRPSTPRTEPIPAATPSIVDDFEDNSEETSFIRDEQQRKNRRGIVETV